MDLKLIRIYRIRVKTHHKLPFPPGTDNTACYSSSSSSLFFPRRPFLVVVSVAAADVAMAHFSKVGKPDFPPFWARSMGVPFGALKKWEHMFCQICFSRALQTVMININRAERQQQRKSCPRVHGWKISGHEHTHTHHRSVDKVGFSVQLWSDRSTPFATRLPKTVSFPACGFEYGSRVDGVILDEIGFFFQYSNFW